MKPQRIGKNVKALLELSIRDDLIITPTLNEFLVMWDGDMSQKAVDAVSRAMRERQRDRSGAWSASAAGKCKRRQELTFLKMPVGGATDSHLQLIFDHGTWIHYKWQAMLLTGGFLDSIELKVRKPSQRIRCSMDGAGIAKSGRYKGREFGFELKSRNDWQFNKQTMLGIDDGTQAQVDFSFMMSGLDFWVVINENKNNQILKEWVFVRDDERVKEMRDQVKELNRAIDIQRLHPMLTECKKQLKNSEWTQCPFGGSGGSCIHSGNYPSTTP